MEMIAAIAVSLAIGAFCGSVLSRPAAMTALRKDLGQIGLWLFTPIPASDPDTEYVGRHRIAEPVTVAEDVPEIVPGLEFR